MNHNPHATPRAGHRRRILIMIAALFIASITCTTDPVRPSDPYCTVLITSDDGGSASTTATRIKTGSVITVSASPNPGSLFTGWHGTIQSNENPLTITVTRNLLIHARFAATPTADMVLISSKGKQFLMGSSAPNARSEEQPVRATRFAHDFFICRHEVTQQEFRALRNVNPAATSTAGDMGDSFPVFNVSWYEAALYCNARSKAEGYDTVYSYTAIADPGQNAPYVLENLVTHHDRFGYRLPTEAEWEFACRGGATGDFFWGDGTAAETVSGAYAWFTGNSGNHAHPVGLKTPNAIGLSDMTGNVGEWVGDWMAPYGPGDTVDPIGPTGLPLPTYESSYARPVRGGSWRLGSSFLRSSSRSGPYSTSARVVQNDIGFRVALGVFFPALIPEPSPGPSDTVDITFQSKISDLIRFFGTSRIKLAFVTGGDIKRKLHYIDFSEPGMIVHALPDPDPVFAPAISPDGRHVAYSSSQVGFNGTSHVTVRSLADRSADTVQLPAGKAFIPHWWVQPGTTDTFIVYTNGASFNRQPQWVSEQTFRQRISAGAPLGAPIPFPTPGSYHGGISADGRFLGTSYPVARLVDMGIVQLDIGDTNIFYFTSPWNGRTDDPQTCNLTMSPSLADPGDALLLDFGYPGATSTLVGAPYDFHAVIFKCTMKVLSKDHVAKWFVVPAEFAQWNDIKYTNHPDFAVAIANTQSNADHGAVYVLNVRDSSYLKIATGPGISSPFLWIDPIDVPQTPDPYRMFARYDLPIQTGGQLRLVQKMKLFWHERESVECIAIGSSPTFYGLNPAYMPHIRCINIGWPQSQVTSVTVVLEYMLHLVTSLKAVVVELDPGFLDVYQATARPRLTGLYDSEGYKLDRDNRFWRSGVPDAIRRKADALDSTSWPSVDSLGFIRESERLTGGWGPTIIEGKWDSISDTVVQQNLARIATLADSCKMRGITLLVVQYPESPGFKNTDNIGRYGPTRAAYRQVDAWLRTLETQNSSFHFYDANNYGDHDYADIDAWDCNHLSYIGARKLAARVDSVLAAHLGR